MPVEVIEDTDVLIGYGLHGTHKDTIFFVLIYYKQLFVSPVGCDLEQAGEVRHNTLLGIDGIGKYLVGACLQFFHW